MTTLTLLVSVIVLFYVAGRYVVVSAVRDSERLVEAFGADMQRVVSHELSELNHLAGDVAKANRAVPSGTVQEVEAWLKGLCEEHSLGLAVVRHAADGAVSAVRRNADGGLAALPPESLAEYLRAGSPLLQPQTLAGACAGLIPVQHDMALVGCVPLAETGGETDILIVGRFLGSRRLAALIDAMGQGLRLNYVSRPVRLQTPLEVVVDPQAAPAPTVGKQISLQAGGQWHLGGNAYETIVTLHDVYGTPVGALSVSLPISFTLLAKAVMDKLLLSVSVVGIFITLLFFYVQSRGIVRPLMGMTRAVLAMANDHTATRRLRWTRKDEFGDLARALDGLLDRVSEDTRELAAREEQHLALLSAVPDVFCVFNVSGVLESVACGCLDRRRLTDALRVGAPISAAGASPESASAFETALRGVARERTIVELLLPATATAVELHVECRMSRIDDHRVLVVCRDMTDEYAARRQLTAMEGRLARLQRHETLGRLVAGIAHDFNNLLTVIQTSVENQQRDESSGAAASSELPAIAQAARHAGDLIRQLQIYAGISDMTFAPVNLNLLLSNTRSLLRASVPHHIALEVEKAAYLPEIVADSTQMLQIVSNLLINAAEAIGENPGTIRLTTRLVRRTELNLERYAAAKPLLADCYVQIGVADTGRGIAPSQVGRILEPFFSTKGEGRGLGLATVAGILDAHDGAISVTSQLGEGTVFSVILPAPPPRAVVDVAVRSDPPRDLSSQPLCVLLVDDDPRIRAVTRLMLQSLGCDVLEADQEREARLMVQKHLERIDVLLLDANVRGMDGVRALRVIRQKAPSLPTYLISGHDEPHVRRVFAGLEFNGFIPKPFTRDMMVDMLLHVRAVRRRPESGAPDATAQGAGNAASADAKLAG